MAAVAHIQGGCYDRGGCYDSVGRYDRVPEKIPDETPKHQFHCNYQKLLIQSVT